jgi:hypothetical protein
VSTGTAWDTSLTYNAGNVPLALVRRDSTGDFVANIITAEGGISGGSF